MNIQIQEKDRVCSICLLELYEAEVTPFIANGIVLLSCPAHTKIAAEMVDKLSQKLRMMRMLTNDRA
jgi:hypothetical protein